MQRPCLEMILQPIGIDDIHTLVVEPTVMAGPDLAEALATKL